MQNNSLHSTNFYARISVENVNIISFVVKNYNLFIYPTKLTEIREWIKKLLHYVPRLLRNHGKSVHLTQTASEWLISNKWHQQTMQGNKINVLTCVFLIFYEAFKKEEFVTIVWFCYHFTIALNGGISFGIEDFLQRQRPYLVFDFAEVNRW